MERAGRQSDIVDRFLRVCRDRPARALIHLPGRSSVTAAGLWELAQAQAERLDALGIGPDHLVAAATGNRVVTIALWLACRIRGNPLMPVDVGTAPAELRELADRFGAVLAIAGSSADRLAGLGPSEPFLPELTAIRLQNGAPRPDHCAGAAILKLTSGSTGLPKATFTTDAQIVSDTAHIVTAMDIAPDDSQLAAIPLSHAYGFGNLLMPLVVQGTPIVLRDGFVPHQLLADAMAYDIRVFPGVPFMFDHLVSHVAPGSWPRRLARLISAGARLDPGRARVFHDRFGVKIHSFYGTSETGGIAFDDTSDLPDEVVVGRAMPEVTIALRPADGAPAGGGRIHVRGPAVASGYVGEDAAGEDFTGGGFLTGDLGRFDASGRLVLTGRASAFINVAGRKVQPEEVEQVVRAMPGIADVQILGAPDPIRGQQVVACYVAAGEDPGVLSIRQFCAARLAPHKLPRTCIRLDAVPRTERGKVDRQRLLDLVLEHLRRDESGVL